MPRVRFFLSISEQQFLGYYRGEARVISVIAEDGRRVEFPADHLRPYIRHDGVQGHFELQFSDAGKFVALVKLDGPSAA